MQRDNTAHSTCAPEKSPTLPAAVPPATPPKTITKTITNPLNVIGSPIGRLITLTTGLIGFFTLAYFIPMAAMAITCSVGLYLANTFVDGQFTRGRRHGK